MLKLEDLKGNSVGKIIDLKDRNNIVDQLDIVDSEPLACEVVLAGSVSLNNSVIHELTVAGVVIPVGITLIEPDEVTNRTIINLQQAGAIRDA